MNISRVITVDVTVPIRIHIKVLCCDSECYPLWELACKQKKKKKNVLSSFLGTGGRELQSKGWNNPLCVNLVFLSMGIFVLPGILVHRGTEYQWLPTVGKFSNTG